MACGAEGLGGGVTRSGVERKDDDDDYWVMRVRGKERKEISVRSRKKCRLSGMFREGN